MTSLPSTRNFVHEPTLATTARIVPIPMENSDPATTVGMPTAMADDEDRQCILCQDAPVAVRLWECGHAHTCACCMLKFIESSMSSDIAGGPRRLQCPTCKKPVLRIETVSGAQPEFVRWPGTGGHNGYLFEPGMRPGQADKPNFGGLVPGCIDADVCK